MSDQDAPQVIKASFSNPDDAIEATFLGAPTGAAGTNLDEEQIWKKVFDPVTQTIRIVEV